MENLTHRLIESHLVEGRPEVGTDIALAVDQIFLDDSMGPMIALELEAMGITSVAPDLAVAYVDHLLLQETHRNDEDHSMLASAARKYGMWLSRAGNGICHSVHMERFGLPGATLAGSDSHTNAAGAIGMLAVGIGGIEVGLALAGEPLRLVMPEVWGVRLHGKLAPWVSAEDVILDIVGRLGVDGALGAVLEYYGPGLEGLSVWDRSVIAHMGSECGATTSVFPSGGAVRSFLENQDRGDGWRPLPTGEGDFDQHIEVDLGAIEPLIALPSSPGNVVPVSEVAGTVIHQAYIGSSSNPGFRDLAVPARMMEDRPAHPDVSLDVNPASRQVLEQLISSGDMLRLVHAGARVHQAGCNGCPGMGQSLAPGKVSLRTVPRNFPGRSGTGDDRVYLCGPETAAASAIAGVITDPLTLGEPPAPVVEPPVVAMGTAMLTPPLAPDPSVELEKSEDHVSLPIFDASPDALDLPVVLTLGDDVSTDEIMPAGSRVMPHWSNLPKASTFTFEGVSADYSQRARAVGASGHIVVAGRNFGQGSSREIAALAPRFLGLRLVVAIQFGRIFAENLVNFGVVPLRFVNHRDLDTIAVGDRLAISSLSRLLAAGEGAVVNVSNGRAIEVFHDLSPRRVEVSLEGGVINVMRSRL